MRGIREHLFSIFCYVEINFLKEDEFVKTLQLSTDMHDRLKKEENWYSKRLWGVLISNNDKDNFIVVNDKYVFILVNENMTINGVPIPFRWN